MPRHQWLDASKDHLGDFRHRAARHHSEGIAVLTQVFGPTLTLSTGRVIPTRWVAERHIVEDLGRIPTLADRLHCLRPEPWMGRSARLSVELDAKTGGTADFTFAQAPEKLAAAHGHQPGEEQYASP